MEEVAVCLLGQCLMVLLQQVDEGGGDPSDGIEDRLNDLREVIVQDPDVSD